MLIKTVASFVLATASLAGGHHLLAEAQASIMGMNAQVEQLTAQPLHPLLATAACAGQWIPVADFKGSAAAPCRGQ